MVNKNNNNKNKNNNNSSKSLVFGQWPQTKTPSITQTSKANDSLALTRLIYKSLAIIIKNNARVSEPKHRIGCPTSKNKLLL